MTWHRPLAHALTALALLLLLAPAAQAAAAAPAPGSSPPELATWDPSLIQTGRPSASAKTTQLWNVYGGTHPDGLNDRLPEGQFNTLEWFPELQGWTPVDITESSPHWHVSAFNASNLDTGSPNHAVFSGVEAGTSGYDSAPGYGNSWNDWLDWKAPTNPTISTQVRLVFDYNLDTEPGYDFFVVEYDSANVMKTLAAFTGTTRDSLGGFTTPGHFDSTLTFTPLMYSGNPRYNVHLRLRVISDSAWSDEDGLYPSSGAVQVDNLAVYFNGNLATQHGDGLATFEDQGGSWDMDGWAPVPSAFAGNFGRVWPQLADIDPCRREKTPQIGFVDDGTPPLNSSLSTGGAISPTWTYGVEGGYVVNYNGGLTEGGTPLANEFWSPEISWDDPHSTLDDGIVGGGFFRAQVWQHLPLLNGMFWVWHVRSFPDTGGGWSSWADRNFVYYGENPVYNIVENDFSDLLVPNVEKVQIALGVVDASQSFDLPGNDATPSPFYDNVSVWKYDAGGPIFTSRDIDLFQDGFPNSGTSDWINDAASASVRLDAAIDINPAGTANVAGDSIVVDVKAVVPGTTLDGPGSNGLPVMRWVLEANPWFDAVRVLPPGATLVGQSPRGFDLWMGTVEGDSARTSAGAVVDDRYAFDAPNDGPGIQPHHAQEDAMFFPGDLFRWFLEAKDSSGLTNTFPADTTGFHSGVGYSRVHTVRALPTVLDEGGNPTTPPMLAINDFGHRGGEAELISSFGQNGLVEGLDYDVYTVRGPSSLVGNGIGSAGIHGANGQQLEGYSVLFYVAGNLSSGLISDGSDLNGNDKSNDVATLTDWHGLPGDRYAVYFGDNIASSMISQGASTQTYLNLIMGVDALSAEVRPAIGGQTAPYVEPSGEVPGAFVSGFVAFGGCLSINSFDHIQPMAGAVAAHAFTESGPGSVHLDPAASVWYDRDVQVGLETYRRVDLTFPYGLIYVTDNFQKTGSLSSRARMVGEVLAAFGSNLHPDSATGGDAVRSRRLVVEPNHPNPFNPSTTIRFVAPARGRYAVKIYNQRGELVETVFDGAVEAGASQAVVWDGTDAGGRSVSSGVYLYQVQGAGFSETRKMALVK